MNTRYPLMILIHVYCIHILVRIYTHNHMLVYVYVYATYIYTHIQKKAIDRHMGIAYDSWGVHMQSGKGFGGMHHGKGKSSSKGYHDGKGKGKSDSKGHGKSRSDLEGPLAKKLRASK
jgi:hypothetical protein